MLHLDALQTPLNGWGGDVPPPISTIRYLSDPRANFGCVYDNSLVLAYQDNSHLYAQLRLKASSN